MRSGMNWIDSGNPSPKSQPESYAPHVWRNSHCRFFSAPEKNGNDEAQTGNPGKEFFGVLHARRSRRDFSALQTNDLALLLWNCAEIQANSPSSYGFELELRPTPSAGAIHPIHILINLPGEPGWFRYDAYAHAIFEIEGAHQTLLPLRPEVEAIMDCQHATLILLVAEPGKTFAKYDHASSLIWRDAGALSATLGLAAEALGLNFCQLGITGEPWASQLAAADVLTGVGLAAVGRPAPQPGDRTGGVIALHESLHL